MWRYAKELLRHREILYMITWREITIKYKQSVMGFLWAVLIPLVIVGAGVLVRAGMAFISGGKLQVVDVATVSLKSVPWAFVVAGIRFGTGSLIQNANLVTKIYVPREIFPLAAVTSQLVDFVVATIPLALLLALAHVGASVELLWVPLLLLVLVAQVSALSIILSAGSLFFRDIKYLVEVGLTFAIFVTPVLYEVSEFGKYQTVLLLNPVAPVLEGLTATVIHHHAPAFGWLGYSVAVTLVTGMIAVAVFRRVEPYFAEAV